MTTASPTPRSEEATVCGLPIEGGEDIVQPLAALVIIKMFDGDSPVGVGHKVRATAGLSTVEALGMVDYARVRLEDALRREERGDGDA